MVLDIENELEKFINETKNKSPYQKKLYHFNSTVNLSNGLSEMNDLNENTHFKKLMVEYLLKLESLNYKIDSDESFKYYQKYHLPTGRFLIHKRQFGSKGDIFKYIILGIVIDFVIYNYFHYYFFITPVLYIIGIYRRRIKIKEKRFFDIRW